VGVVFGFCIIIIVDRFAFLPSSLPFNPKVQPERIDRTTDQTLIVEFKMAEGIK